jgi:hypothetical protein
VVQQLPAITSWGQAALLLIGFGVAVKWLVPTMIQLIKRKNGNGPNGQAEKRTYEAVNRLMERIEGAEKEIIGEIKETKGALVASLQRIEDKIGARRGAR